MAQIADNEKGFKVIQVSRSEIVNALGAYGAVGICDSCNTSPENGFYIAVLDRWYCHQCYVSWLNRAIAHPEDRHYEERKFQMFRGVMGM